MATERMLEFIVRPRPRVCMCIRWWIGVGGWCSDWLWRRWMGLHWRRGSYLLLSIGNLWVIFCGLRGSVIFCRRIVCRGLRRGSHVWSARERARHVKIRECLLLSHFMHHGSSHGTANVLLAAYHRSIFTKHRGIRRRSGFCVVHSALNAAS